MDRNSAAVQQVTLHVQIMLLRVSTVLLRDVCKYKRQWGVKCVW